MLLRTKTIIRLYCKGKHSENELYRTFGFLFTAWVSFGLAVFHGTDFTRRASVSRPTPASAEPSGKKAAPEPCYSPRKLLSSPWLQWQHRIETLLATSPLCRDPQSFLGAFERNPLSTSKSGRSCPYPSLLPVLRVYINHLFLPPY